MKRSTNVVLTVMAAAGIGGTAYALQPRDSCRPPPPGTISNDIPQDCRSSSHSSSGSGHSSSWHFFGSGSGPSNSASPGTTLVSTSGATQHGGFGSIGHAFASFSGGG